MDKLDRINKFSLFFNEFFIGFQRNKILIKIQKYHKNLENHANSEIFHISKNLYTHVLFLEIEVKKIKFIKK